MSASKELERFAVRYANDAIQLDKSGAKTQAVTKYQRAVEVLLKLCQLYPSAPQNKIYMEHAESYQKRIKELKENKSSTIQVELRPEEKVEAAQIKDKPAVRWSDIANLTEVKKIIQESIIFPTKRPDLFPLGWPRGILLFGPPGCGKTLIAAATANEIDGTFYLADAASIMSKWLGESEKNVAKIFEDARASSMNGKPSIVFIDEIDSLMKEHSQEVGGETRTRNQFLKEMDSISDKNRGNHLYVIGATNKPWALDPPFIRRFQKRILIPPPDYYARVEMFKLYSKELDLAADVDLEELARRTEGYSGSDIKDIFQTVQLKIVREFFESSKAADTNARPRPVRMQDFLEVFKTRKPSITTETLEVYDKWYQEFKAL